jgi:hypothetical protein
MQQLLDRRLAILVHLATLPKTQAEMQEEGLCPMFMKEHHKALRMELHDIHLNLLTYGVDLFESERIVTNSRTRLICVDPSGVVELNVTTTEQIDRTFVHRIGKEA